MHRKLEILKEHAHTYSTPCSASLVTVFSHHLPSLAWPVGGRMSVKQLMSVKQYKCVWQPTSSSDMTSSPRECDGAASADPHYFKKTWVWVCTDPYQHQRCIRCSMSHVPKSFQACIRVCRMTNISPSLPERMSVPCHDPFSAVPIHSRFIAP